MNRNQKSETKIYTAIGLDFETGGLDCAKSACTQIALQGIRLDTMEVLERYVQYIYPYNRQNVGGVKKKVLKTKYELEIANGGELMEYEPKALEYSGLTMDVLQDSGIDLKVLAKEVIDFAGRCTLSKGATCKPVLIGQNVQFDIGFFQQLMNYAGLLKEFEKTFAGKKDFYGNFQPHYIDSIDLGRLAFAGDPAMTSFKLELMAERFGVELDDAHDADADVTATLNIVRVCANRLRNPDSGQGVALEKKVKSRSHFKI